MKRRSSLAFLLRRSDAKHKQRYASIARWQKAKTSIAGQAIIGKARVLVATVLSTGHLLRNIQLRLCRTASMGAVTYADNGEVNVGPAPNMTQATMDAAKLPPRTTGRSRSKQLRYFRLTGTLQTKLSSSSATIRDTMRTVSSSGMRRPSSSQPWTMRSSRLRNST